MDTKVQKLGIQERRALARELATSLVVGVRHQGMRLLLIRKFMNQLLRHSDQHLIELRDEQQKLAEFERRLYDR